MPMTNTRPEAMAILSALPGAMVVVVVGMVVVGTSGMGSSLLHLSRSHMQISAWTMVEFPSWGKLASSTWKQLSPLSLI